MQIFSQYFQFIPALCYDICHCYIACNIMLYITEIYKAINLLIYKYG